MQGPVRIGRGRDGVVFVPFHYGYWDQPGTDGAAPGDAPGAANELTLTEWDPVSKQPMFKTAAVKVTKIADGTGPSPAPTTAASAPADPEGVPPTVGGPEADVREQPYAAEPPQPARQPETSGGQPGSGGTTTSATGPKD